MDVEGLIGWLMSVKGGDITVESLDLEFSPNSLCGRARLVLRFPVGLARDGRRGGIRIGPNNTLIEGGKDD